MAQNDELVMNVKTNIKSATKDTVDWRKQLSEVNESIQIQNEEIVRQERILIKLKAEQDKMVKGGWSAGMPALNKKIAETTELLNLEKNTLKDLKNQQKAATTEVKAYNNAQKESDQLLTSSIGNYKVMGVSLNGIRNTMSKIIPTAKAMFSTITAGIISTGIGALLVAFGTLMTWFTKTKAGAETLSRIFAGLGAAVSVIVDRITDFASAVGTLFSGDIMGGLRGMRDTFTGIGDEMVRETALAIALKKSLQDLADSERQLNVETAKRKAEVEDLKLKSQDLTLTEEERIKALEDASAIEADQMAQRVEHAEEAVRIQKAQMEMSKNMAADLDILAQKEIALANIRREEARAQQVLIRKTNAIRRKADSDRRARERKAQQERAKIRKENNDLIRQNNKVVEELNIRKLKTEEAQEKARVINAFKAEKKIIENSQLSKEQQTKIIKELEKLKNSDIQIITDKFDKEQREDERARLENLQFYLDEFTLLSIDGEKERLEKQLDLEEAAALKSIENLEHNQIEKTAIIDLYKKKREKLAEDEAKKQEELDKAVNTAKVDLANNAFGALSALAGENEQLGKAVAVTQTIFNTQQGIMAAMGATSVADKLLPFWMRLANATTVGIMGAKAIQNIMSASSGNIAETATAAEGDADPSPEMMGGTFALSGAQEQQPIQAYVVTDEITNSQNGLARIRRRATI